jgi:hypothetical protein
MPSARDLVGAEGHLAAAIYYDAAVPLEALDAASAALLSVLLQAANIENIEMNLGDLELDEHGRPKDKASAIAGSTPASPEDRAKLILHAQVMIGCHVHFAVRAARAVLSVGYEFSSPPFIRILVELIEHRKAIDADQTAREAQQWLAGRRSVKDRDLDPSTRQLYKNLTQDSHGDIRTVQRLFDPTDRKIDLTPKRTHRTRATLLILASIARDQAVLVADRAALTVSGVENLDRVLAEQWKALTADVEGESSGG